MSKVRRYIEINGIVQGVGFRPFVYKLAKKNNLTGWVNNNSKGVHIDVEGNYYDIDKLLKELNNNPPPLAKIIEIKVTSKDVCNYDNFKIEESVEVEGTDALISPDMAICNKCIEDIKDINNRRYRYPFTNCTNCGPRYSIIKSLPYDRKYTSMNEFQMCKECNQEYINAENRRFHAQPNGCEKCGPKIELYDNNKNLIKCDDYIKESAKLLKEGKIIAIKGIGGFHLACDARNFKLIEKLRAKKNRPDKPLAVMMKDISVVKKYCNVSKDEEKILLGNRKPILLLNKKEEYDLPQNITKLNKRIGVMLPYTPLHYLIFEENIDALIMTSGNKNGEPMIYDNCDAFESLAKIADYFLIHNRKIINPIDDSISKVLLNKERVLRNGRGYCPLFYNIKDIKSIVALGGNSNSTITISNNTGITFSPYIGNLDNIKTYGSFSDTLNFFKRIYKIEPEVYVADMHPFYYSNEYLKKVNKKIIKVQHHHAHIVSCLEENNISHKVIGVAYDGTGYGLDGNIWGSEFLICDKESFKRVAHLEYVSIPGGEGAIKEPWKMAISYIYDTFNEEYMENIPIALEGKRYDTIIKMIKNKINCPLGCSMGRLFDAVSAILGIRDKITFQGQAAIELEYYYDNKIVEEYSYDLYCENEEIIISVKNTIKEIINDLKTGVETYIISSKFHNTIVNFTVNVCKKLRRIYKLNKVALSGGAFQNEVIFIKTIEKLKENQFDVITNATIPCNDCGISFGQIIVAKLRENKSLH